ncbi:MAG: 50S ribosomal protein L2 [bacterium]
MKQYKILTKKEPEKRLTIRLKNKAGKGGGGRITISHKGGRVKRLYRIINFGQEKMEIPAKVVSIEYDPNRTSFICLLEYADKDKRYVIAPDGIKIGDDIICDEKADIKPGNRMKIKNIPVGTQVYNVELEPGKGGKMIRGAGTSAKIMNQEDKFTHLILPSTETRMIPGECFASVGQVSFPEHKFIRIKNAGANRRKGIRPTVRGTAMNPVDHPHGGGEGRSPIGLKHPKTPWGKPALGVKTRKKKKWTKKLIIQRRKKKKR